jgi:hypothetical protein
MTIAFGRRRLILSLITAPVGRKSIDVPEALDATDKELARLNSQTEAAKSRLRWESNAIMMGGMRPR